MSQRRGYYNASGSRGFTLVETAIVLLIVGLVIGAIAIPLTTRIESRRIEDTTLALDLANGKLLEYAARLGYFPCPADGASNGGEPAGTNHATGNCPTWFGFLPAVALAWTPVDSQGYALDAWGSRIRYAVSNDAVGGVANPFTRVNGVPLAGMPAILSTGLLRICATGLGVNAGIDCGGAATLASNAVAVVWSTGPNAMTGGTSIDEAQNPNPNGGSADRIFVSRARADPAGAEYDDIVRWIPGASLAGRF